MDFLRNGSRQFVEVYRALTPSARLTLGLLCVLVIGCLAYLAFGGPGRAETALLHGRHFDARELTAVEQALEQAGLQEYRIEGSQVLVPADAQYRYEAALVAGQAMPGDAWVHLDRVFQEQGIFSPSSQTEVQLEIAKQRQLSEILRQIPDIETATVSWDRQRRGFGIRQEQDVRATVMVQPRMGRSISPQLVTALQHTVAGWVSGLSPANVAVTDLGTGRTYSGEDGGLPGGNETLARIKESEDYYAEKIREQLSHIPGVQVAVHVELDPTLRRIEQGRYPNPQVGPNGEIIGRPVPTDETVEERTHSTESVPGANEPGVRPNTPGAIVSAASGNRSTDDETRTQTSFSNPVLDSFVERLPMMPTRVTAAIGVPRSFYVQLWQAAGNTEEQPTDEQLATLMSEWQARIEQMVAPSLPPSSDGSPTVTVTTFWDFPAEPVETGTSITTTIGEVVSRWGSTIGLAVLALASVWMIRSALRKAAAEAPAVALGGGGELLGSLSGRLAEAARPAAAAVGASGAEGAEGQGGAGGVELEIESPRAPVIRDKLQALIRKDPDGTASVLRRWIGTPK